MMNLEGVDRPRASAPEPDADSASSSRRRGSCPAHDPRSVGRPGRGSILGARGLQVREALRIFTAEGAEEENMRPQRRGKESRTPLAFKSGCSHTQPAKPSSAASCFPALRPLRFYPAVRLSKPPSALALGHGCSNTSPPGRPLRPPAFHLCALCGSIRLSGCQNLRQRWPSATGVQIPARQAVLCGLLPSTSAPSAVLSGCPAVKTSVSAGPRPRVFKYQPPPCAIWASQAERRRQAWSSWRCDPPRRPLDHRAPRLPRFRLPPAPTRHQPSDASVSDGAR